MNTFGFKDNNESPKLELRRQWQAVHSIHTVLDEAVLKSKLAEMQETITCPS